MPFYLVGQGLATYNQQPPSGLAPDPFGGYTDGLVIASSIPYEGAWTAADGWVKANYPHTNKPSYGKTRGLGKTMVATTAVTPVDFPNVDLFLPPLSVMFTVRQTTQPALGTIIGFGGSGSSNGWAINNTGSTFGLTYGGVEDYVLPLPQALVAGDDYVCLLTIEGTTATLYYNHLGGGENQRFLQTSTTVATMATPAAKPLTIGCVYHPTNGYSQAYDGHIGTFALWKRALRASEAKALLDNPYQIWHVPTYGEPGIQNVNTTFTSVPNASGAVGTTTTQAKARATVTGVQATTALGLLAVGNSVNHEVVGVQGLGTLGDLHSVKGGAGITLVGVQATSQIGASMGYIGYQPLPTPTMRGELGNVDIAGWNAIAATSDAAWARIQGGG